MGGGHVSEGYDRLEQIAADAFAVLARTDAGGWVLESAGARLRPEYGVQFATMRQIGGNWRRFGATAETFLDDPQTSSGAKPRMLPVA